MKTEFAYANALTTVLLWADTGSKVKKSYAVSWGKMFGFFFQNSQLWEMLPKENG